MFFHTSKNDKVQSKKCQNCIPFLESTYPEMQRKHIPINQVQCWLMLDEKCFFIQEKMTKSSQKRCQNCIPFLESTYPEMQRKHIPRVYEYQS